MSDRETSSFTLSDGTVVTRTKTAEIWYLPGGDIIRLDPNRYEMGSPAPEEFSDAYRSPDGLRWLAVACLGSVAVMVGLGWLLIWFESPK